MTEGRSSVLPMTNVRPPHDQCTCMRAMPFIYMYRGHQGPVHKGHLEWKSTKTIFFQKFIVKSFLDKF